MKKVTAFIGSDQKRATYAAVRELEKNLKQIGEVDFETVFLSDYRLEFCRGCRMCFEKGEARCPLKDDRDALLEKLEHSDGVIFASPSYAFQVTGRMKNFLDRIAFIYHRPRFFGKAFTAVVTQGMPVRGGAIRKYLESTGADLGFNTVRGGCVWTLDPMNESRQKKLEEEMKKLAARFHKALARKAPPVPSLIRLMVFRMARTGLRKAGPNLYDYHYYKDKGWFESGYFYQTALGPGRKILGRLFDFLGSKVF